MQTKLGARRGHNNGCRDRMEKALEEDDMGDGRNRSKLQKENIDQHVAAEGETLLNKGEAESKNERSENENMMDDAEDLECAPGSSSDIRIATPVKH